MSLVTCPRVIVGGNLIDGTGRPTIKNSIIVINGDWIVAVGSQEEVVIPEGAEVIEASGKTVLPGFIDAHTHFLSMGIRMIQVVDLSETSDLAEAIERVESRLIETPKGNWILGRGWDESKWNNGRYITKEDLDTFSPNHPIMLTRVCGHLITLNSKALEMAEITKETSDPPGGQIDRDSDNMPTGVLRDARPLVEKVIPDITKETALKGLKRACNHALSLGCTGVHDAGGGRSGWDALSIGAYQTALKKGYLRVRVYLMQRSNLLKAAQEMGIRTGFGNKMLRLGSVKLLIDGSMGARTAALFDPYEDDSSTKGLLMMDPEELTNLVKTAHKSGLQVAIHAIGDRGIEHAINSIEEALRETPMKNHRHRIEHCEVLNTNQIERLGQLKIVASMQPNFVGEWSGPGGMYEARLGARRYRQNNPYRILIDEGVKVAFGSDCMPFNPVYGLWSAVNHPIKKSRITIEEAVKCYTLEAAYASFEEEVKGSIEPGKLADITILDGDFTEMSLKQIKEAPVHMTLINGKILYLKD